MQEKRMTDAGLSKIDEYIKTGKVNRANNIETRIISDEIFPIPDFIINDFSRNEPAWTNFSKLPQSFQKQYILWITNAKREETIRKRIDESIKLLKENKRLGLK